METNSSIISTKLSLLKAKADAGNVFSRYCIEQFENQELLERVKAEFIIDYLNKCLSDSEKYC